ncbi:class I SAM-dependent methyltransferase [Coleofasciculus chthonoplastes]|uniref:class I SAM-dependent methyltransferase n=1 Tax=Coleofasciculus chthonoplastes TaxID=64178 RepID=UPI0032F7C3AA
MNKQLNSIIKSYPLIIPRLYNYLRIFILPIAEIAKYVPEKGKILDVGCGYGILDIYLAKTSPNRQVIGSELNSKRVKIASSVSRTIENVEFFQENLLQGDKPEKFDGVVLIDLLHHITSIQQQQLLQAVANILKKDGQLIIKDMDTKPAFKFYWNLVHDKLMTGFERLNFIGHQELIVKLEEQGFNVSFKKKINHPLYAHYLLIAIKK